MSARPAAAEQRVGQRMGDDVTVGVADEPSRMVDRDATEDKRHPLAESVRVHTEPDPQSVHPVSVSA